jgi:hypothetical protein
MLDHVRPGVPTILQEATVGFREWLRQRLTGETRSAEARVDELLKEMFGVEDRLHDRFAQALAQQSEIEERIAQRVIEQLSKQTMRVVGSRAKKIVQVEPTTTELPAIDGQVE